MNQKIGHFRVKIVGHSVVGRGVKRTQNNQTSFMTKYILQIFNENGKH